MKAHTFFLVAVGVASLSIGCKGSPASPFNSLQDAPVTIVRLQNYQTAAAAPTTPGGAASSILSGLIPGLAVPTEFQAPVQQAQSMICGLAPMMPGCATGATTPPVIGQTNQMFGNYAIIGSAQVMDSSLRKDLIDVFGYEKGFQSRKSSCFYPEFGMAFGSGQTANVLVSFGCNQVQAQNFQWPHPDVGMTDKTVKTLLSVVQKAFGG